MKSYNFDVYYGGDIYAMLNTFSEAEAKRTCNGYDLEVMYTLMRSGCKSVINTKGCSSLLPNKGIRYF